MAERSDSDDLRRIKAARGCGVKSLAAIARFTRLSEYRVRKLTESERVPDPELDRKERVYAAVSRLVAPTGKLADCGLTVAGIAEQTGFTKPEIQKALNAYQSRVNNRKKQEAA